MQRIKLDGKQFLVGAEGQGEEKVWISWEKLFKPKTEGSMVFKDLKAFNLVLLAKQGWQILQNPSSITHKILKVKYFARSIFMEANLERGPSYVWRSLLAARETIERGSRWIIGNGKRVNIWRDRWIPTPNNFKVVSPRCHLQGLDSVEQLINKELGLWDAALVKSTFLPLDSEAILSIPISPTFPDNSLVWAWTKNGNFTVRSAYGVASNLLKEGRQKEENGSTSNKTKMKDFWKFLW